MTGFTNRLTDYLNSNLNLNVSYRLEMRNGYQGEAGEFWTFIPVRRDGWGIRIVDGDPVVSSLHLSIAVDNLIYLEEFNSNNPIQAGSAARFRCTVHYPDSLGGGEEFEYIFRGVVKTKEIVDQNLVLVVLDLMDMMRDSLFDTSLTTFEMEAHKLGPFDNVPLSHASNWDEGAEERTFEITRAEGYEWAFVDEDLMNRRRAWAPSAFIVETFEGGEWEPIPESDYMVDAAYGVVRFFNDMAGEYTALRLNSVTVYLEGTLEFSDVVEAILRYPWEYPYLGCGVPLSSLSNPLTGEFTLTNGSKDVTGAGTQFTSELEPGQRIAHSATDTIYGIVESITNDTNLVLKFPYKGSTAAGLPGYVSTIREADLSLSNINWFECDGKATDLYRRLQQNYGDSRGFKVWWDHRENKGVGERVRIKENESIELSNETQFKNLTILEDLATAVKTKGKAFEVINLAGRAETDVELLADNAAGWIYNISDGHQLTWNEMTWSDTKTGQEEGLNDRSLTHITVVSYISDTYEVYDDDFSDFVELDLQEAFQLSRITLSTIQSKNPKTQRPYRVRIMGKLEEDDPWEYLTPETYDAELRYNNNTDFDLTSAKPVRYIKISMIPWKWGYETGQEKIMALREVWLFGSQEICETAVIQNSVPPGIDLKTGTITFNPGGPPFTVTGVATQFTTELSVGDLIALNDSRSYWAEVASIANNLELTLTGRYQGVQGASGNYGTPNFAQGQGGHFLGGSDNPKDFIVDYYPALMSKMFHVKHPVSLDDSGVVLTPMMARDRAYIMLNEMIRLYRQAEFRGIFDPRIRIFDTVKFIETYRATGDEEFYFLVASLNLDEKGFIITGIEYGAGVAR